MFRKEGERNCEGMRKTRYQFNDSSACLINYSPRNYLEKFAPIAGMKQATVSSSHEFSIGFIQFIKNIIMFMVDCAFCFIKSNNNLCLHRKIFH